MKDVEIIIKALMVEAQQKPNERIIFGRQVLTYAEFAKLLQQKKLQKSHEELLNSFLKTAVKMFRENTAYKQHITKLAGIE